MTELERLKEENDHLLKLLVKKDSELQAALERVRQLEHPLAVPLPEELVIHREAVTQWLAYKKERKQSYKPMGLKKLYDQMIKYIQQGVDLQEAVNCSIAANYSGLFPGNRKAWSKSNTLDEKKLEKGVF